MTDLLVILWGIVALVAGAELLVRGAARLATAVGISPLVVGLTVVSLGTSAPELAVTVGSGLAGRPDVGVGNVVGSNILNVFLILGLAAALRPLDVSQSLVRREVPFLIAVSIAVWLLAFDGSIGRFEGLALLVGAVAYTAALIREGRAPAGGAPASTLVAAARGSDASPRGGGGAPGGGGARGRRDEGGQRAGKAVIPPGEPLTPEVEVGGGFRWIDPLLLATGLLLLLFGARWLVEGAVSVATSMGVSEAVVGLTVVAVGTSLPEVATSVLATLRGQRDMAVGNVVGSNLFNLLLILGAGSLVTPGGLAVAPAVVTFDLPIMIAAAVACLPVFFSGYRIGRWEGLLFIGYYLAYTLYVILAASQHDALEEFGAVMAYFVVPVTLGTLVLVGMDAWKESRGASGG